VREFDAERRLTKTSAEAGGSTYAVEQVSYDTLGRVDCRTTRMNPASFDSPPAACTATTAGAFGPDRILKYDYDNAECLPDVPPLFSSEAV
jgi:hypothetical protein